MGILGAARIAPLGVVKPARTLEDVAVTAVAARSRAKAEKFAAKHGIPTVHASYESLLADPDIDAVYNPLPNGLHAEWTLKALAAGKHVLCEKPFTSNEAEAVIVADAAASSGLVVTEAYHWRYHPLAARMREVMDSGELGIIREIRTALCFPLPRFSDIRYSYELGGGALMDTCYTVSALRFLGTGEPSVVSATAKLHGRKVDRAMEAEYVFPDGVRGFTVNSMWSSHILRISARVTGDDGEMKVTNFVAPHYFNRLTVKSAKGRTGGRVKGEPTYTYQLRAFAEAVLRGGPNITPPADAIKTMHVIDSVYRAAGLPLRGLS